jgi:hypothetical protein
MYQKQTSHFKNEENNNVTKHMKKSLTNFAQLVAIGVPMQNDETLLSLMKNVP